MSPQGLYLHVPFCAARCSFCAFVTWADRDHQAAAYAAALEREIETRCAGRSFDTAYLGGGTPSHLDPGLLAGLLARLRAVATLVPEAEVTLEANPESVDRRRAEAWLAAGCNRVSLGAQAFDAGVLAAVGRLHSPEQVGRAVADLKAAGFTNISLDLIAGLPGQDLAGLADSRARALALAPDHLSLYLLELDEAGKTSPLAADVRAGRVQVADADLLADAYEASRADFEAAGLECYEISNFARPGRRSRHNLKYWRCQPFLACGVAAHWLDGAHRRHDVRGLDAWLALVAERGEAEAPESRCAPPVDLETERVLLGLRLAEGVVLGPGQATLHAALDRHVEAGLVTRAAEPAGVRHVLTGRGALLSNEVFVDVLAAGGG